MTEPLTLGIDIGGTKVAGGVVDGSGTVLARARRDTPHRSKSPRVVEDTIASVVEELRGLHPEVAAVGIGAAGVVAEDRATVVFAPHLSWRNEPLRAAVARIPADRLVLETDCPYLTPEPWRGKQNHPALVGFTAVAVAGLRGVPVEELWALCADNAGRFFGL